jgi:hypothetical protein
VNTASRMESLGVPGCIQVTARTYQRLRDSYRFQRRGLVAVIGAVLVLALNHPIGRRVRSWMLLVPIWIGAVVCVSHGIYGFATKALYLSGRHGAVNFPVVPGVSAATAAAKNHLSAVQDLVVFEPCFVVEGVLLALAGWQFIRTPAGRRTWSMSMIVGIVAIDVFGALLSLGGMHVAIS